MRLAIDSKELSNGAVEKLAQFFKSKCQVVIEQVLPYELTSNMNAVLLKLHLNVYENWTTASLFMWMILAPPRSCAVMGLFLFTVERSYQQ